jgi:hypothetical protein
MKVYKVEVMVLDFDEVGEDGVKSLLENTKYPNWAIHPVVRKIDTREIEWSDDHPLNKWDTEKEAYKELFGESFSIGDDLREKLADLCHEQWCHWMRYLFSKCESLPEISSLAGILMPTWAVERWKRQMNAQYSELSEEEKDSDRKEADKFIKLLVENHK